MSLLRSYIHAVRGLQQFFAAAAVLLIIGTALVCAQAAGEVVDLGDKGKENDLLLLRDDTFDSYVFPKGSHGRRREPWLIFFFAPWCGHCKNTLPKFADARLVLGKKALPHAKFATVNAVSSPELTLRFRVKSYPTLIYTLGKGENWHVFRGAYTVEALARFAIRLHYAALVGSFADVTSHPTQFLKVQQSDWGKRVPMYVYLPPTSSRSGGAEQQRARPLQESQRVQSEEQIGEQRNPNSTVEHRDGDDKGRRRLVGLREARWNIALDAAASMESVRFGVIFGDDVPPNWERNGVRSYVAVLEAVQRCKSSGPDGAVLVVDSDAYKRPQCYEGPWFEESAEPTRKGDTAEDNVAPRLHPSFALFFVLNGLRAVEPVSSALLTTINGMSNQFLGLLITDGHITQDDTNMLPVLREVVQERNEARRLAGGSHGSQRQISLAYIDGRAQADWLHEYKIELDGLPAFVVLDPRRDKIYRLRSHTPHFEVIKSSFPWPRGGEQQSIIVSFMDDVERGVAVGEKMTFVGEVAELLLQLPGVEYLYEILFFEDALLVVIVFALLLFVIMLLIVLVVEPMIHQRAEERTGRTEREAMSLSKKTS